MRKKSIPLYVSGTTWVAVCQGAVPGPITGTHVEPEAGDWAAVGQSLHRHFGAACRVRLVLSARLCRFLVAPWVSTCFTGATIRTYVAETFASQHDVTAVSHRIEIDWPPYGQPLRATAYPRELVDTIRSGLIADGGSVDSVVASVGPVLRRYGRALQASSALLAYAEDDGITGITVDAGQVAQVEALGTQAGGLDDTVQWFARKRFAFADDGAMRWLATGPKPAAFSGAEIPVSGFERLPSPGHVVAAACL